MKSLSICSLAIIKVVLCIISSQLLFFKSMCWKCSTKLKNV